MRTFVGTSGFSYPEWKGTFYPPKIKPADMFAFYAQRFGTVEINNTFYRMPAPEMLAKWGEQSPEGFAFVLKAPRRITHDRRLADVAEPVGQFVQAAAVLEGKLGPLLFQLPPFVKKDVATLAAFLPLVRPPFRAALEFRHASWYDDEVLGVLRDHGAALCVADTGEPDDAPLTRTASWGYLRLRRLEYTDADLAAWRDRIHAQGWDEAFVFFKHEDEGKGPMFAERFVRLIGAHSDHTSATEP